MPCVLWGVACLSLPGPATVVEVAHQLREALRPIPRGRNEDAVAIDEALQQVDLYRLVPLVEGTLADEERVVAHLPNSRLSCSDINELYREHEDLEVQCCRAQEALEGLFAFAEDLSLFSDEDAISQRCWANASPVVRHDMLAVLRQENHSLRRRLEQSEVLNRELQEMATSLQGEFSTLLREVLPSESPPGTGLCKTGAADGSPPSSRILSKELAVTETAWNQFRSASGEANHNLEPPTSPVSVRSSSEDSSQLPSPIAVPSATVAAAAEFSHSSPARGPKPSAVAGVSPPLSGALSSAAPSLSEVQRRKPLDSGGVRCKQNPHRW